MAVDDPNADLLRSIHNQAGNEIANLQTALFSTITVAFATFSIGLILGLKDLVGLSGSVFQFPWVHIIPLVGWVIVIFVTAEATFVFISCIDLGLKRYEIEHRLGLHYPLSKEQENFTPNDEAGWLMQRATRIYFPSLCASGLSHPYFIPLFVLTPVFGSLAAVCHFMFLHQGSGHPAPAALGSIPWLHTWAIGHPLAIVLLVFISHLVASYLVLK